MGLLIPLGLVTSVVFVLAFLSARRFGMLALGLSAGYILSNLWSEELSDLLGRSGLIIEANIGELLSIVILLFAPVIILLFGGYRYDKKLSRLLSASMVAMLSATFLAKPLTKIVVMDDMAISLYGQLAIYWPQAITIGLVLGILDIVLMYAAKKSD